MNVIYFLLFSAFFVDVKCNCGDYIECFTEFLQEFFGSNATEKAVNIENGTAKYIELDHNGADIEKILTDITALVTQFNGEKKTKEIREENEKTKIYVQSYEFGDNKQVFVAEETTESPSTITDVIDFTDILNYYTTTPATIENFSVIPLHNDEENEIVEKVNPMNAIEEDSTDYPNIDYIDIYKDTTNEDVGYKVTQTPTANTINGLAEQIRVEGKVIDNNIEHFLNFLQDDALGDLIKKATNHTIDTCNGSKTNLSGAVFPWIATIFVRNDSKDSQFEYFCDGALVSDRLVLTAARCLYNESQVYKHEDFVVILGKTSLQVSGGNENILRVMSLSIHPNFTTMNGEVINDLGLLVLEDPVTFNDAIALACLEHDEGIEYSGDAVTTAWSFSGDLTLIYFDKEKSKACGSDNKVENTFCATYGNDVPLCPSYGGVYVEEAADSLYLYGVRYGNPRERGLCFSKDVTYTSLRSYSSWIKEQILGNKS